ncbi:hypothetical protein KJF94_27415 [Pseudomonas hormoni]|uniref:O-antigen ligase family protein n=1 Tax=Pseudomonas hormoni TaxID=3093767 RepID=A0ABX8EVQ0_9PSED|nr:hypothetical protein [Pseudomonas hormoni]QVW23530.1 hypothetical protein KJF94_27415 [Pseudomonas hormoni]
MTWRSGFSLVNYKYSVNRLFYGDGDKTHQKRKIILFAIASFLILPLFFQISNGVFHDTSFYFNSGGELALLPIPLSTIMSFVGIVLLGGLTKARLTLAVLLLTCLGMLAATALLAVDHGSIKKSKLILLAQYVLPMCALVLGQQYGVRPGAMNIMAKAFTLILVLAVPAQLISTLASGLNILSPSLFLFSAYQHLQYIPVIFVGAFLVAIFTLWEFHSYRLLLSILAGLMGAYVSFSLSILAIVFLISGMVCFSGRTILLRKKGLYASVATLLTILILACSLASNDSEALKEKLGDYTPSKVSQEIDEVRSNTDEVIFETPSEASPKADEVVFSTPRNLTERAMYLTFYMEEIVQNSSSILLGHLEPPDRGSYPSAHNYYVDFIYNFGVLAIIPLLGLAGFTVYSVIRNFPRIFISSKTLGIAGVVLFLLFADNMFKVGMRQPHPGLMTFYLWGVLLALLMRLERRKL